MAELGVSSLALDEPTDKSLVSSRAKYPYQILVPPPRGIGLSIVCWEGRRGEWKVDSLALIIR